MERWYEVPKGERGRKPSDGRLSDFRCQTGSVQRNVPPTYDGQHGAERFLDSARNDHRAALWPRFRGFRRQEKVLKFDRPLAGGFLGLTGLWPEGCGIAFGDEYIVQRYGISFPPSPSF